MARTIRWLCLSAGLTLLTAVGAMLLEFARLWAPFGGIAWSWDLLRGNLHWVIAAAAGASLVLLSAWLFARARRPRSN